MKCNFPEKIIVYFETMGLILSFKNHCLFCSLSCNTMLRNTNSKTRLSNIMLNNTK